jgi:hypothetical protein
MGGLGGGGAVGGVLKAEGFGGGMTGRGHGLDQSQSQLG